MSVALETPPQAARQRARRLIIAASIGNALEFYEIVVYAYFASTLAPLFFPRQDPTASLIATYAAFGLSFLARPIGALVLGRYADRAGRKSALLVSISLMMVATLLLSLMPTYSSIGVLAPIGLMVSRLVQGFAVAGEFASSTALLAEHDPSRKGYLASWQFSSQGLSTVVASLFGVLLTSTLSADQLSSWGWRVPFLFGLMIGPIGLYVRRQLDDSVEFQSSQRRRTPLLELWREHRAATVVATLLVAMSNGTNYLISFMPVFATRQMHLPESVGFASTLLAGLVLMGVCPLAGHLSDRVARLSIMRIVALLGLVTALPAFALLTHFASASALMVTLAWFAFLKAAYAGPMPALMADMFPSSARASGLAIAYNVSVMVFGGFAPFFSAQLIEWTGSSLAPAVTLIVIALVALGALSVAPRWLAAHR